MIFSLLRNHGKNLLIKNSHRNNYLTLFTRMTSNVTIGTHNGHFHCDEALACFMLKLLPEYKDASIVRSRDQSVLNTCTVVVDVGGEYNPKNHRYDHHMREFKETFDTVVNDKKYKSDIKLSCAGLIYCHFGKKIIQSLLPSLTDETELNTLFTQVYESFMKEIDGIDNGIPMFDGEPRYVISTHLGARVSKLNPSWNAKEVVNEDELFKKAVALTGDEFVDTVKRLYDIWMPARNIVEDCIHKRYEVDPSGEIIELTQTLPWKEHLFRLEEDLNIEPKIKYAIYQDKNNWRVHNVPISRDSFISRLCLPEAWLGKRDEDLSNVAGIKDCIFVHATGFIGGNKTRSGALEMARKSLEIGKTQAN